MYDTIVIGAGPGGLTTAIYLARAGKKVLVAEKMPYGGQAGIIDNIVNYPGLISVTGFDLIDNMMKQASSFGAQFTYDEVVSVDTQEKQVTFLSGKTESAKSIVLATGCKAKSLGLAGEESLVGSGVSYCATCDGGFFKGKTVAVVGKGDKAKESVIYLRDIAKKTYFITTGEGVYGAETINGTVTALLGKPLSAVKIMQNGQESELALDGLFISVGYRPLTHLLSGKVEMDEDGYIIARQDLSTSADGIYAVGDIVKKSLRQIVTATADGAICAQTILRKK